MLRFVSFLLAPWLTWAQTPPEKPTFSTFAHLVIETVAVTDKSGNAVSGLTAKDFRLIEDGREQTIAFAEFQQLTGVDEPAPAFTEPVAPLPRFHRAQISSGKPGDIRYRDRRLFAIYFDLSAMPPGDQSRAIRSAEKFVRTQMGGSDLVAIFTYTGGAVEILNDFTSDRKKLLETLATLTAGEEQNFTGISAGANAADTGAAFGQNDSEFNLFNTDRQLAALQTAASMLGRLSEKKTLLYFASGLRLNGVDNQAQLHATTNAAVRAGVSFWPIDARGLIAMAPMGNASSGSPGGLSMYTGAAAFATTDNVFRTQDTLYELASSTGGKALQDTNDLTQGFLNAGKAFTSYYLVGYYTANTNRDGKLRKVRITLNVGQTAKLDYRQAYYAEKEWGKFTAADKERQLEEALMLGDPVTELTIALEINYFQLNRAEYFVPISVKIPGSELARAKKGGAERTVIDFIGEIREGGGAVANVRDKVDIKLSEKTAAELAKRPLTYDTGFTLLPGKYTLKFLARDAETGRMGTYLSAFVIPNLNNDSPRFAISSIVLSAQSEDMKDAIYNAKDKLHAQELSPLVHDGRKIVPSVTRVFHRAKQMTVYVQTYQQQAERAQPVVGFVSFYRASKKVWESPPMAVSTESASRLKTIPIQMTVPLAQLAPGKYVCQMNILNPATSKAAFWRAPVLIVE